MSATVLYEARGPVGIITLDGPEKLNAISRELRAALIEAFLRADEQGHALGGGCELAPLYAASTETGATFGEITRNEGLGAALRSRREQFAAVGRGE